MVIVITHILQLSCRINKKMASEIRVNKITHTAGVGTITTNVDGIVVAGIVTANSFSGINSVTATTFYGSGVNLTGIDASTLKFGNDVKVTANNSGAIVTGILTATNAWGIGTTTTTGRNAGVGTAVGTIIFNSTSNKLEVYANDLNWRGFSPT